MYFAFKSTFNFSKLKYYNLYYYKMILSRTLTVHLLGLITLTHFNGCANNSHLRTNKLLEKGETVQTLNVNAPIPMIYVQLEDFSKTPRIEYANIRGYGNSEAGYYIGFAPKSTFYPYELPMNVSFGYESRQYKKLFSSMDCKIGYHGEFNFSPVINPTQLFGVHLMPSIVTATDDYTKNYYGFHSLISYSFFDPHSFEKSISGIGFTTGFDGRVFQIQFDITALQYSYISDDLNNKNNEGFGYSLTMSLGKNFFKSPSSTK